MNFRIIFFILNKTKALSDLERPKVYAKPETSSMDVIHKDNNLKKGLEITLCIRLRDKKENPDIKAAGKIKLNR